MQYLDRDGKICGGETFQDRLLLKMYSTVPGRIAVSLLIRPWISKAGGYLLNTGISKVLINPFVKSNNIDLSDYEKKEFDSYNDFFIRQIKKELRPVDMNSDVLISPCDSKISVSQIDDKSQLFVKNTYYTVKSLLRSKSLAKKYEGGIAMVLRLSVDDYHRFCYPDSGIRGEGRRINGVFHSVNPVANDKRPIYKENTREYCILKSDNFGDVLMMEVGALMVGKIVNYHGIGDVLKGQEKGRFEFGGSTVILLFEKDRVLTDADILKNSADGYETKVKMGEKIGVRTAE